jgi:hypothetical protein
MAIYALLKDHLVFNPNFLYFKLKENLSNLRDAQIKMLGFFIELELSIWGMRSK